MGVKIGNIDIANEVVELHFQVLRTQLLLEEIIKKNNIQNLPNQAEMNAIEDRVIEVLNKKFPDMGIKKK
ncbi:hypothetical protein N9R53_00435 [Flavobacteriaceae bacterium]|nr:hypothetical protein [Flavobacteriaceae bacterium]